MKKLLALVLALVMTLSLCTVTNAAYPDAADVDYKEAVDVMSAVGVFQGDEKGNFNPDAILTRETAAKLIAYLDLGAKTAEALPAVKVFSDVEANRWSAKYVAYCADAGYIAGVGDGSFNPTGELTGYAFGKLLLCVLGYDANIEGLTGAAWSINVAKLMEKNGIAADVDSAASAALSREAAAQYCLNALKADCVEYENKGTNVTINGAVIATGASAAKAVEVSATAPDYNGSGDKVQQLCEKLYKEDLELINDEDDFKRPAYSWQYKDEDVGPFADTADYTFTSTKGYTVSDEDDLSDAINDQLKITKDSSKLVFASGDKMYTNGGASALSNIATGSVVEVYLADNSKTDVASVVVTEYTLAKITKVDTNVTKAQKEDGVSCKITVDGTSYTDTKVAGFDADTYVKNAYILYAAKGSKIIASQLAEVVEGKVTSSKGETVSINGTSYKNVTGSAIALNGEGKFYLNAAGQIALTDVESTSDNYALVYNIDIKNTGKGNDGLELTPATAEVTAYAVLSDGTKASYPVDYDYSSSKYYFAGTTVEFTSGFEGVIAYSVNDDGQLVYETAADTLTGKITSATVSKSDAKIGTFASTKTAMATSDTVFVFEYAESGKVKTSVTTGYKNVNVSSDVYAVVDNDNDALFVFVSAKNGTLSSDVQYAVILDAEYTSTKEGSDTLNTYAVAIDGEETTLTLKNATISGAADGDIFAFTMSGDYATANAAAQGALVYTKTAATATTGDCYIAAANDDYLVITTKNSPDVDAQYNVADIDLYTVTFEYDANGDLESVSVASGADVDADDSACFVLDGAKITTMFIAKEIH